jgi:glutaminyl-peptide cyclotransferase
MASPFPIVAAGVLAALVAAGCGGTAPVNEATGSPSAAVADRPDTVSPATDEEPDLDTEQEPDLDDGSRWEPVWAPTDLSASAANGEVASWEVEILDTRPHDELAFTQGFEVHDGKLYESTGLVNESTMRTVDIDTGEVLMSVDVDPAVFAEGMTVVGDRIFQLTYRSQTVYVRDSSTLDQVGEFSYDGEGWGLCYDDTLLAMSNGTPELAFRDPATFEIVDAVEVSRLGSPVDRLNELECADGYVIANIFTMNTIVVIEPTRGDVVATIDASALTLDATGKLDDRNKVLNGIARLDEDTFLLTGKLWPKMYRVRFVASSGG